MWYFYAQNDKNIWIYYADTQHKKIIQSYGFENIKLKLPCVNIWWQLECWWNIRFCWHLFVKLTSCVGKGIYFISSNSNLKSLTYLLVWTSIIFRINCTPLRDFMYMWMWNCVSSIFQYNYSYHHVFRFLVSISSFFETTNGNENFL